MADLGKRIEKYPLAGCLSLLGRDSRSGEADHEFDASRSNRNLMPTYQERVITTVDLLVMYKVIMHTVPAPNA